MPPQQQLSGKADEASQEAVFEDTDNEVLPAYQEHAPTLDTQPEGSSSALGPTVSSPFNFPSTDLPPYSPTVLDQRPIAIPQRWPNPAAPFLSAYPTSLLNYGITAESFSAFLDTMSAFLTARVSKRAISHAGDIATELGRVPQRLGKDVMAQAKSTGKNIATNAKQLNPGGLVSGIIGGAIGLTVGTTFRVIGSVLQLPGTAIATAANPQTPRGRAELYAAAANRDWFHPRGLDARLLNTVELTGLIGVPVEQFLNAAETQSESAKEKLGALRKWIDDLEVQNSEDLSKLSTSESQPAPTMNSTLAEPKQSIDIHSAVSEVAEGSRSAPGKRPVSAQSAALPAGALQLGKQTLWLVLFPVKSEDTAAEKSKSEKRRSKKG
jgi:hypothetical protein